jgi:hypothetical protein
MRHVDNSEVVEDVVVPVVTEVGAEGHNNSPNSNNSNSKMEQATITNADTASNLGTFRNSAKPELGLMHPWWTKLESPMLKSMQLKIRGQISSKIALLNSTIKGLKAANFKGKHPKLFRTPLATTYPPKMTKLDTFCHRIFRTR